MDFFEAMTTLDARTENGMPTHSTSGDPLLDWFFKMGGFRGQSETTILSHFLPALASDRRRATRSLFMLRNIRGGMGERQAFRIVGRYLAHHDTRLIQANIPNIPLFGRWDDLWHICLGTPAEEAAINHIKAALLCGDRLAGKWMPREGKKYSDVARYLAEKMGLSRREYRKLLAYNTDVVETLMCSNRWGDIEYNTVPSVAFSKYKKAFREHDEERFSEFVDAALEGNEKINAGAIHPHTIIKSILNGGASDSAVDAQWANLPDYDAPGDTLVVSDVSGSMNTGNGEPMQVSIALGLYFSERLKGPFENVICTFSARPSLFKVPSGTITKKVQAISRMNWDMNTNLEAVFNLVLNQAVRHNLPQEQMPATILIISDMQFDECVSNPTSGALGMVSEKYSRAGYKMPTVIFWNVKSSNGIPAKMNDTGVMLLSGFSPAMVTAAMSGDVDPVSVMRSAIDNEMYDCVVA